MELGFAWMSCLRFVKRLWRLLWLVRTTRELSSESGVSVISRRDPHEWGSSSSDVEVFGENRPTTAPSLDFVPKLIEKSD